MKVLFLLITLLDNWETFKTTISNSNPIGELIEANVTSSLLMEDINWKNIESTQGGGSALIVKGRDKEKEKKKDSRSKNKAHCNVKDLECYHYKKKGHLRKNCRSLKKENKKGREEIRGRIQCKEGRGEYN